MRFRLIGALAAPLVLQQSSSRAARAPRRSAERRRGAGLRPRPVAERQPCSSRWRREARASAAVAQRACDARHRRCPRLLGSQVEQLDVRRRQDRRLDSLLRARRRHPVPAHELGVHRLVRQREHDERVGEQREDRLLGDTFGRAFDECRSRRGREGHRQKPGAERVLPGLFGPAARQRRLLRVAQLGDDQRHPGPVRLLLRSRRRPGLRSAGADEPRPQPGPVRARECERPRAERARRGPGCGRGSSAPADRGPGRRRERRRSRTGPGCR